MIAMANSSPAAATAPPNEKWLVAFPDGRKIGPVTRQQMLAAMQSGKIPADCRCLRSDWTAWREASEVAQKLGVQLPSPAGADISQLWDQISAQDFKGPAPPPVEEKHGPSILDQYVPNRPPPVVKSEEWEKFKKVAGCAIPYLVMVLICSVLGGPIAAVLAIFPACLFVFAGTMGVAIAVFRPPWFVDGPLFYLNRVIFGKELALTLVYFKSILNLIIGYGWAAVVFYSTCMIAWVWYNVGPDVTTLQTLDKAALDINRHYLTAQAYPDEATGNQLIRKYRDGYSRKFRYKPLPVEYEIRSAGRDRKFDTEDDLVFDSADLESQREDRREEARRNQEELNGMLHDLDRAHQRSIGR